MVSIFVSPDDGYTLKGEWPAVPGLFPAGTFRYRPAVPEVRVQYEAAPAAAKAKVAAGLVAGQVKEITVAGEKQSIRVTAEQALTLHADVFQSLLFACLGYTGPVVEEEALKNFDSA